MCVHIEQHRPKRLGTFRNWVPCTEVEWEYKEEVDAGKGQESSRGPASATQEQKKAKNTKAKRVLNTKVREQVQKP